MPAVTVFQRFPEDATIELIEPTVDQEWVAFGSENPQDIYAALNSTLPFDYDGLYLTSYCPSHKGGGWWNVRVHYSRTPPLLANVFHFSGETTSKTLHRETSIQTVASYPAGAPNFKGLIGVSLDNVAGVDLVSPGFNFNWVKRFYSDPTISGDFGDTPPDENFISYLLNSAPRKNVFFFALIWKAQVLTFDAGELLFHGVQIADPGRDPDGNELMELQYKMEFSRNFSADNGNAITNLLPGQSIEKDGWDYLWVYYQTQQAGGGVPAVIKVPKYVYVEQSYESLDFMTLGM
jgi:hypothetical protein